MLKYNFWFQSDKKVFEELVFKNLSFLALIICLIFHEFSYDSPAQFPMYNNKNLGRGGAPDTISVVTFLRGIGLRRGRDCYLVPFAKVLENSKFQTMLLVLCKLDVPLVVLNKSDKSVFRHQLTAS